MCALGPGGSPGQRFPVRRLGVTSEDGQPALLCGFQVRFLAGVLVGWGFFGAACPGACWRPGWHGGAWSAGGKWRLFIFLMDGNWVCLHLNCINLVVRTDFLWVEGIQNCWVASA